jgi:hypothetical protein
MKFAIINSKSMDVLEDLMQALENLTNLNVTDAGFPRIKTTISSVRKLIDKLYELAPELKKCMSKDDFDLFLYQIDDLAEVADDVERVFFVLRKDKNFMESVNRLFNLF